MAETQLEKARRKKREVEERTKHVPRIGNDGIAVEKMLAMAQEELDEARAAYDAAVRESGEG